MSIEWCQIINYHQIISLSYQPINQLIYQHLIPCTFWCPKLKQFDPITPRRRLPSLRETHQEAKASSYFCCSTGSWRVSINLARVKSPKPEESLRKKLKHALHSLDPGVLRWSTSWRLGSLITGFTSFPKTFLQNLQVESSEDGLPPPGMASTKMLLPQEVLLRAQVLGKVAWETNAGHGRIQTLVSSCEIHQHVQLCQWLLRNLRP